jgi:hypothetical protein
LASLLTPLLTWLLTWLLTQLLTWLLTQLLLIWLLVQLRTHLLNWLRWCRRWPVCPLCFQHGKGVYILEDTLFIYFKGLKHVVGRD